VESTRHVRARASILACVFLALSLLLATNAFAANPRVEKEARLLDKKAMDDDYFGTNFTRAQDRLSTAITRCGVDKCDVALRAQLRRDLGMVLVGGQIDRAQGIKMFAEAIALEPQIALNPDLRTKDIDAAWAQAKGGVSGAVNGNGPARGDFKHSAPTEQVVSTPVPLYAEYAGAERVVKVVVKYKGFGMTDFRTIALKAVDGTPGYEASIPCSDVQEGLLEYYLQGFNGNNDPVASSGDPAHTFKVAVKKQITGEAPHLPGMAPPAQCSGHDDCPPDFPGCKQDEKKGTDAACSADSECTSNSCVASKCAEPPVDESYNRFWIGVEGTFDLVSLPSATDVCYIDVNDKSMDPNSGLPINGKGYYCVSNGADFPSRTSLADASALVKGSADKVAGGFAPGSVHVMVAFDYAVWTHLLLGARVGYVANTYPGAAATGFAPLHLEARATFVIGPGGVSRAGPMGYVYLGGGVAPADAKVEVNVVVNNVGSQTVDAWNVEGPGFGTVGFGFREQFTKNTALQIGPKASLALGGATATPIIGPDVSFQIGF
jgi:hypothetical protein